MQLLSGTEVSTLLVSVFHFGSFEIIVFLCKADNLFSQVHVALQEEKYQCTTLVIKNDPDMGAHVQAIQNQARLFKTKLNTVLFSTRVVYGALKQW